MVEGEGRREGQSEASRAEQNRQGASSVISGCYCGPDDDTTPVIYGRCQGVLAGHVCPDEFDCLNFGQGAHWVAEDWRFESQAPAAPSDWGGCGV